jgi:hypothetical protein
MNPWLQLIIQITASTLTARGKREYGEWLTDALAAQQAGRNIDAELLRMAQLWATNGEPTFDEIAQSRLAIQQAVGD